MGGRDQDPRGRPTHQNLEGSKQLLARIFYLPAQECLRMEAFAEHVQYQLPNQHPRVGFLLDAIQNNDAGLQAAIGSVRTDDGPTGKRNDFEAAATHFLPYDPVAKKRLSGTKREAGMISSVMDTG
jgi:hypothetical protein